MRLIVEGTDWAIDWGLTKDGFQYAVVLHENELQQQYFGNAPLTNAVFHIAAATGDPVAINMRKDDGNSIFL